MPKGIRWYWNRVGTNAAAGSAALSQGVRKPIQLLDSLVLRRRTTDG